LTQTFEALAFVDRPIVSYDCFGAPRARRLRQSHSASTERQIAAANPTTAPKNRLGPSHPGLEFSGVGGGHVVSSALPQP